LHITFYVTLALAGGFNRGTGFGNDNAHATTTTEKVTGILNFQNRNTGNMGENPRVIACGEIKAADHSSKPNFG